MMLRICIVMVSLVAAPALAQTTQQRPTAAQMLAQELGAAVGQNAELAERLGKLEDENTALKRQIETMNKQTEKK
jgi:hypothetical protein